MNILLLRGLLPEVAMSTMFRGVMPFVVADMFRLGLLIGFPVIATLLPRYLG
jgi:TRAP-type mannitol/chloroaromatic compound transport system permease large subunit